MSIAARREALGLPYQPDHAVSVARSLERGVRPRTLSALMAWFLAEWQRELPDRIHEHSVWRGYASANETPAPGTLGGSLSGSPAWTDPFRRFIENSPHELDGDGFYSRPMRAALASIAGRDPNSDSAYKARYLWTLGASGGNWRGVAERALIPYPLQGDVTEGLLGLMWSRWRPKPEEA